MRPQQAAQQLRSLTSLEVRTLRLCLYLSAATLIWALGLIVLGALVSATEAGSHCAGWPLCNGQLSPASDIEGSLIFGHRFGGFAIVLLSTALVGITQIRLKSSAIITRLSAGVFVLVLAQSVVGGVAVVRDLPTYVVSAHLMLAFAVTGILAATIVVIRQQLLVHGAMTDGGGLSAPAILVGHMRALALLVLVAALFASLHDGVVSASFNELRTAFGSPGGAIALQLVAGGLIALLAVFLLVDVALSSRINVLSLRASVLAGVGFLLAVLAGLLVSILTVPAVVTVVPVALAATGWAATIALLTGSHLAQDARTLTMPQRGQVRAILRDFARVSKPGIMLLLLVTTLGAMLIAQQGWPPLGLILLTLLGGALASGGASALNCYYDRDIDGVMARTRKRPIPTGGLTPDQVRAWGLTLSVLAVAVLAVFVNPLAATMALSGNLFYVLVYTRKLKRSTPQNIVIGGAAGSFPPLVGWAAATGSLSLGAFLIAAIIFYWTPPHFWSLALLKANDYKRAGIPMLPVTHGDHETRRRIVLYSFLLLAVTLLMVPAGVVGLVYGVTAAVLGTWFVIMAVRMFREGTSRLAWPLFKYSNYYLAALLATMALDHALRF